MRTLKIFLKWYLNKRKKAMIIKLEDTLDQLYEIEGIEACMLYRIDGVPITLRAPGYREDLLETMFWLEKHIKRVLGEMNREGLKETIFYFRNSRILIAPSSNSTVLVTIAKAEANQQLISLEALRATRIIESCVT
jgi:predicted regulator of Ras-like GTPase activity (Roadblock/LC7/MglB family)